MTQFFKGDKAQHLAYNVVMSPNTSSALRFCQFNVENLFIYLDHQPQKDLKTLSQKEWSALSASTTNNKPLLKTKALASAIREIDPDILMLNEVGGIESLENFNRLFLDNQFTPYLIEGNSDRGIDVGYLVKTSVNVKALLLTHKNRPIDLTYVTEGSQQQQPTPAEYLCRDVAELRLFAPGEGSPRLVILLTHLKSKLDPESIDPEGRIRRAAELQAVVDVYNEVTEELDHKVPIIVAGDFNGNASPNDTEPEFSYLYEQSDLIEIFDSLDLPQEERATHILFPKHGAAKPMQIDYVFVSPDLKKHLLKDGCFVYQFKSELNVRLPKPENSEQRSRLPSDHYPIVFTINNVLA